MKPLISEDYQTMLEEGYADFKEQVREGSRLEYLSENIFNFTTYEIEYSEMFAKKALEVCAAIEEGVTFEYIQSQENRLWYLLMVNMPFFADKLEWGTSIRGAWWREVEFSSCGLWLHGEQLETMKFTREQWHNFIAEVLVFGDKK